jgi:hypothetical protein
MYTNVGLWIDHRNAFLVFVKYTNIGYKLIKSRVDKQLRRFEGLYNSVPYESQLVLSDNAQKRKFTKYLVNYYDEIINSIRDAKFVFIFGPGEAKKELVKRLKKNKINGYIENIEGADKMTTPQILAKVRTHFINKKYSG